MKKALHNYFYTSQKNNGRDFNTVIKPLLSQAIGPAFIIIHVHSMPQIIPLTHSSRSKYIYISKRICMKTIPPPIYVVANSHYITQTSRPPCSMHASKPSSFNAYTPQKYEHKHTHTNPYSYRSYNALSNVT